MLNYLPILFCPITKELNTFLNCGSPSKPWVLQSQKINPIGRYTHNIYKLYYSIIFNQCETFIFSYIPSKCEFLSLTKPILLCIFNQFYYIFESFYFFYFYKTHLIFFMKGCLRLLHCFSPIN